MSPTTMLFTEGCSYLDNHTRQTSKGNSKVKRLESVLVGSQMKTVEQYFPYVFVYYVVQGGSNF